MSISEVSLVNSLGQPFIQIYADDRGLFANDEDEFVSAMGMHSTNFSFDVTPQFIQNKLETTRNPLIAIYSSDDRVPQFHAIVIISIAGDGSITDGTRLGIIDPVDGLTHVIPYDEFYRRINLVIDRDDRDRVARAKIIYY